MKKIVITDDIKALIEKEESFLNRSIFRIFTVTSNEEALSVHRAEKANLIITKLDMPKMSCETFCSVIRNDEGLRTVSIIVVCAGNESAIEKSSKCKANIIIAAPIDRAVLLEKAHQLLNISERESYRVLLGVKASGNYRRTPFLCRSENISASGMLIETDKIFNKGDIITCSFFLPDSTHISTTSEIVRVVEKRDEFDTNQYGIKFYDITPEKRSAIEAFIEKRVEERSKGCFKTEEDVPD